MKWDKVKYFCAKTNVVKLLKLKKENLKAGREKKAVIIWREKAKAKWVPHERIAGRSISILRWEKRTPNPESYLQGKYSLGMKRRIQKKPSALWLVYMNTACSGFWSRDFSAGREVLGYVLTMVDILGDHSEGQTQDTHNSVRFTFRSWFLWYQRKTSHASSKVKEEEEPFWNRASFFR